MQMQNSGDKIEPQRLKQTENLDILNTWVLVVAFGGLSLLGGLFAESAIQRLC